MHIQLNNPIPPIEVFPQEVFPQEEAPPKKRKPYKRTPTRTIVWTPETRTKRNTYEVSLTEPIFTLPELVFKIFSQLSMADVGNFEAVCKGHRFVTFPLWESFKEKSHLTYNWKVCDNLEFKEKINYILSSFLLQYVPTAHRKKPLKVMLQKMEWISHPFPIFKTFFDGMERVRTSHKSLDAFCNKLQEEPILHAALKIYRLVKATNRANKYPIPIIPPGTLKITSQAISEGATCLSKLAVTLCKQNQKRPSVFEERYAPFLFIVTMSAKNKKDNSGREALAAYATDNRLYRGPIALLHLHGLIQKQVFIEPTADEILSENQQFRNLYQQISHPQAIPETHHLLFYQAEQIILAFLSIARPSKAEVLLDVLLKKKYQLSSYPSYITAIRVKTLTKKLDEVNTLYDQVASMKNCIITQDLSFLTSFVDFKLTYQDGDPETANFHMMNYWKNGTWKKTTIYNYANCKLDIQTVDDLQNRFFQQYLTVMISIKEKLGFSKGQAWFKNVQAAIMVEEDDKKECLTLHNEWTEKNFYQDTRIRFLPMCLQEKIKRLEKTGSDKPITQVTSCDSPL